MATDAYKPHASRDDAAELRYERRAFVVMMALFLVALGLNAPMTVRSSLCV